MSQSGLQNIVNIAPDIARGFGMSMDAGQLAERVRADQVAELMRQQGLDLRQTQLDDQAARDEAAAADRGRGLDLREAEHQRHVDEFNAKVNDVAAQGDADAQFAGAMGIFNEPDPTGNVVTNGQKMQAFALAPKETRKETIESFLRTQRENQVADAKRKAVDASRDQRRQWVQSKLDGMDALVRRAPGFESDPSLALQRKAYEIMLADDGDKPTSYKEAYGLAQRDAERQRRIASGNYVPDEQDIADLQKLHPEVFKQGDDGEEKAAAYLRQRHQKTQNEMAAPGTGTKTTKIEDHPAVMSAKFEMDDADDEVKARQKALDKLVEEGGREYSPEEIAAAKKAGQPEPGRRFNQAKKALDDAKARQKTARKAYIDARQQGGGAAAPAAASQATPDDAAKKVSSNPDGTYNVIGKSGKPVMLTRQQVMDFAAQHPGIPPAEVMKKLVEAQP